MSARHYLRHPGPAQLVPAREPVRLTRRGERLAVVGWLLLTVAVLAAIVVLGGETVALWGAGL